MSQRHQLERILEIDRRVRARLYPNPDQLAQELEVSRRVIFNDRHFLLNQLGAPLAFDRQRGGWYYTDPTWVLPTVFVTEGELLSFFLSVEIARRQAGTGLGESLKAAVTKIARSLPDPVSVDLEALHRHHTFASPAAVAADEATWWALHRAIGERRQVHIFYHTASRNVRSWRKVDPHHVHHAGGDWYLIAWDHKHRTMRTFNLGRIERFQVLDGHFLRQTDFDAEKWLRESFGTEETAAMEEIAVRFDAYQATYIRERHWHDTQQIEVLPDGVIVLRLHTSGLGAVKRWVLQYGAHAEVLAPASLRAEIAAEVRRMREIYE